MVKFGFVPRATHAFLCAALVLVLSSAANAQAVPPTYVPPVFDYAAIGQQVVNTTAASLTQIMPFAFGILALLLGVGIAWRFMKKGAKTS